MKKQMIVLAMFCASMFYVLASAYGANAGQMYATSEAHL